MTSEAIFRELKTLRITIAEDLETGEFTVRPRALVTSRVDVLIQALRSSLRTERHDRRCACVSLAEHLSCGGTFDGWLTRLQGAAA
jgi:hypothetical protein